MTHKAITAAREALIWVTGHHDISRDKAPLVYEALALLQSAAVVDEAKERIVRAAQQVVAADTYVHPMLSRADAVKAGVAELHDAVNAWQSLQTASSPAPEQEGGG